MRSPRRPHSILARVLQPSAGSSRTRSSPPRRRPLRPRPPASRRHVGVAPATTAPRRPSRPRPLRRVVPASARRPSPRDADSVDRPGFDVNGTAGARAVGPGARRGQLLELHGHAPVVDVRRRRHPAPHRAAHPALAELQHRRSPAVPPLLRQPELALRRAARTSRTSCMYKKMPAFIPHLTTEAAVVLRFDLDGARGEHRQPQPALYDAGSYIRLFYNTNDNHPTEGISRDVLPARHRPLPARLPLQHRWGGTARRSTSRIFPSIQGSSPGLKVQYDRKDFYAFAGFKTASIVQPTTDPEPGRRQRRRGHERRRRRTTASSAARLGLRCRTSASTSGAGYFQQGKFDLDDVAGQVRLHVGRLGPRRRPPRHAGAAVGRLPPLPQRPDGADDPLRARRSTSANERAWSISAEVTQLEQNLKNFDVAGADEPPGRVRGRAAGRPT